MAKKTVFPKELLIYVIDWDDDGTPIFAIAANVSEISEDIDGSAVAKYAYSMTSTFRVRRELK